MPSSARQTEVPADRAADARPFKMLAKAARIPTLAAERERGGGGSTPAAGTDGLTGPDRTLQGLTALRADPRQAIEEHRIRCLICGQGFRQLTNTHLRAHNTDAVEYKQRFGYNRGRPLMCHALQRLYADRAVKSGLATRIRCRPILVEPGLRRLGGSRAIALEELLTRREARRRSAGQNGAGARA